MLILITFHTFLNDRIRTKVKDCYLACVKVQICQISKRPFLTRKFIFNIILYIWDLGINFKKPSNIFKLYKTNYVIAETEFYKTNVSPYMASIQ